MDRDSLEQPSPLRYVPSVTTSGVGEMPIAGTGMSVPFMLGELAQLLENLAELARANATLRADRDALAARVVALERLGEDHELASATHLAGGIGLACVCGWLGPMVDGEFELVETWGEHLIDVVTAALAAPAPGATPDNTDAS